MNDYYLCKLTRRIIKRWRTYSIKWHNHRQRKTATMNNACMQIALMRIFNQEHKHVKNAKGKESHGWHCVFVWHAAMWVVVILLLVCTGPNTIGKQGIP